MFHEHFLKLFEVPFQLKSSLSLYINKYSDKDDLTQIIYTCNYRLLADNFAFIAQAVLVMAKPPLPVHLTHVGI